MLYLCFKDPLENEMAHLKGFILLIKVIYVSLISVDLCNNNKMPQIMHAASNRCVV